MTAAEEVREALRLAREAVATAEAAARAAGVDVTPRELTAERIRIVDADGGLRLVIAAHTDEVYVRGRVVNHAGRRQAGLIFVNDDGTECGGLIWDGSSTSTGGQFSLDSFEQDQAVTIGHGDEGGVRRSAIQFTDRPRWSLVDQVLGTAAGVEVGQPDAASRMRLAKEADGSVGLTLFDQEGRPRLQLQVDADGEPSIALLDAEGGLVS